MPEEIIEEEKTIDAYVRDADGNFTKIQIV